MEWNVHYSCFMIIKKDHFMEKGVILDFVECKNILQLNSL